MGSRNKLGHLHIRYLYAAIGLLVAAFAPGCATQEQVAYNTGQSAMEQNDLDAAFASFQKAALTGNLTAMTHLGTIEERRGNLGEAKTWHSLAAVLGHYPAGDHLAKLGILRPKVVPFGVPLDEDFVFCDVLLQSAYVLPDSMALHFKVINTFTGYSVKMTVNQTATNRGWTALWGTAKNSQYYISNGGTREFQVVIPTTASTLSVSLTCENDTDLLTVPLTITPLRAAIDAFSTSEANLQGSNEVRMTPSGGVYEVPVTLNDVLRINFVLDTGAADVLISPDVALTLYRTGTIESGDWLPGRTYSFADGSSAKSSRFLLRSVQIGNRRLGSVACAISQNIGAPMLLGQSVLERLGKYSIDYDHGVIRFE